MGLGLLATIGKGAAAGMGVYSTIKQTKDAKTAARFNIVQTGKAAKVAAEDSRQNALRKQESHRKYLGSLRANLLAKSGGVIDGGDKDMLDESVGNLQMQILDDSVASQRQQAAYANQAFSQKHELDDISSAAPFKIGASVLDGFGSVYSAGADQRYWGGTAKKKNESAG